ncbi:MAG: hypothetical protein ACREOO_01065 [bacterium]
MELTREEHLQLQHALQGDWEIPGHLVERFEQHLGHCRDCQGLLKTSGQLREKIKEDFKASVHLSQEQLLYYLTAQVDGTSLSTGDRAMLARHRKHIQDCPLCRLREQYLQKELAHCEEIVFAEAQAFSVSIPPAPIKPVFKSEPVPAGKSAFRISKLSFALCGVVASCLLVFVLNVYLQPEFYPCINPYLDSYSSGLISLRGRPESAATPSNESPTHQILINAHEAVRSGNARQALTYLAGLQGRSLEGEDLLRFRLYEMMATLQDAHKDYFRLFPHFEITRVSSALEKMKEVLPEDLARAKSLNPVYAGPAYYYAAKACLVLERREDARKYLERSTALMNHRRHEQAEELLVNLDRL